MFKSLFKLLCFIAPNWIAKKAYHHLNNPQVRKLRENELAVLNTAQQSDIDFKNFSIKLYEWQGGKEKVLLIHGWEGQAGNFSDLIQTLQAKHFTIYAFDAPSHGYSSRGKTNLYDFIDLVGILIRKYEVAKLVSHSFGGVATTSALEQNQDLNIDKYALITTPDTFLERIDQVAQQVNITEKVKHILIKKLEEETGEDLTNLSVSNFVKRINVKKALILHDKNDGVIPIEQSKRVASNWPAAQMIEVENTGHFRILRTPEVLKQVVEFLQD